VKIEIQRDVFDLKKKEIH